MQAPRTEIVILETGKVEEVAVLSAWWVSLVVCHQVCEALRMTPFRNQIQIAVRLYEGPTPQIKRHIHCARSVRSATAFSKPHVFCRADDSSRHSRKVSPPLSTNESESRPDLSDTTTKESPAVRYETPHRPSQPPKPHAQPKL